MNSISSIHAADVARQRTQVSAEAARRYTQRHAEPERREDVRTPRRRRVPWRRVRPATV